MTAIIVGITPKANFIVTDALMSNQSEKIDSYNDCALVDKISSLNNSGSYFSLIGDVTLEWGIAAFDYWCFARDIAVDFARKEDMKKALQTTEVYVRAMQILGQGIPTTIQSYVYFIDKARVIEYIIGNNNGKYTIQNFEIFKQGLVVLNYSGMLIKINGVKIPSHEVFDWATQYFDTKHKEIKKKHAKDALEYDFNNRFCGVVFSKDSDIKEMLYSPFTSLEEEVMAKTIEPKDFWKFVNDKEFKWNPFEYR